MLPPIDRLNAIDELAAREALAPLFERAPSFIDRIVAGRPYRSYDELLDAASAIALAMPRDEQIELINGHPRIGAAPASVSALSYLEQGYDHDPGTAELQARLHELNDAYERRFGFRFVVFVAGRPRSAIVPVIEQRLGASRDDEVERALRVVIAIARDRAARMVIEEESR